MSTGRSIVAGGAALHHTERERMNMDRLDWFNKMQNEINRILHLNCIIAESLVEVSRLMDELGASTEGVKMNTREAAIQLIENKDKK